jgi:hypothetical protein
MAKVRTTLMIDEEVLRAVKARGARTGKRKSEVVEEALRHELGLDLSTVCGKATTSAKSPLSRSQSRPSTRHAPPG